MPSTMKSGWFSPVIELAPRITIRELPPVTPAFVTCTPAT